MALRSSRNYWPERDCSAASLRLAETIKLGHRSNDQTISRNGRSRHAHFVEGVFVEKLVLRACLENVGITIFAERENLSIRCPRRSCECGVRLADALLFENETAGASVVAAQETEI